MTRTSATQELVVVRVAPEATAAETTGRLAVAETRAKGVTKEGSMGVARAVAVETAMATVVASVLEPWVDLAVPPVAGVGVVATRAPRSRCSRCRGSTATFETPPVHRHSARCG